MLNNEESSQVLGKAASIEAGPQATMPGNHIGSVANQPATKIKSYRDLRVYQESYDASIIVLRQVTPKLPKEEQYDLADQLRRSAKAVPRLIAEGYGKKHQKKGFTKYIDDAMSEANEIVVSLSHCRDIYFKFVDPQLCDKLIDVYDRTGRQLYRLGEAWANFRKR